MAGMGLPRDGGGAGEPSPLLVSRTRRLCACPSHQDATRFGVSRGCGHGLGGSQACLALAALLGFGTLPHCHLSLTCLLPFRSLFLLTPPYNSCSPWPGQAGQALGVS